MCVGISVVWRDEVRNGQGRMRKGVESLSIQLCLTINERGFYSSFSCLFLVVVVQSSPRHSFHFICKRKKKTNRINLQLLCYSQACMEKSNPISRRPRPSRRSRALKHSLSERSLTLELLPSPFVLVICPPPRSNSLVHVSKITHPNHNGHPSYPHPRPSPRRQTHRPSNGNSNGLLRSDSAHGLPYGLTQCFGRWVPCGRACW